MEVATKRNKTRGLSLEERHDRVILQLALRAGHGNRSRIVQEAIEDKARRELGENWESAEVRMVNEPAA